MMPYSTDTPYSEQQQRPRPTAPERRTKRVELALSPSEYTAIQQAAAQAGLSVAAYIRQAAVIQAHIV